MNDTPNQRLCTECKEWIDARAADCYVCGAAGPAQNNALVLARLNGALSTQVGHARADAAADAQFKQAARTNNPDIANRPLRNYPGYSSLVKSIKSQLQ